MEALVMLDTLKSAIFLYLADAIKLPAFREWFAPYSIDPESFCDAEFTRIAYELIGYFADIDAGELTERNLKMDLRKMYEPSFASSYIEINLDFGEGFDTRLPQTGSLIREAIPSPA
jgi:hypothetical protein